MSEYRPMRSFRVAYSFTGRGRPRIRITFAYTLDEAVTHALGNVSGTVYYVEELLWPENKPGERWTRGELLSDGFPA